MKKLRYDSGTARLIVIMAAFCIVLFALALIPIAGQFTQSKLKSLDDEYVTSALNKAKIDFVDMKGETKAVYDAENKCFVDVSEAKNVTPYGNAKEHKGMVVVVTVDESGGISAAWESFYG